MPVSRLSSICELVKTLVAQLIVKPPWVDLLHSHYHLKSSQIPMNPLILLGSVLET